MINLANRTVLSQFIEDNIEEYNNCSQNFSAKKLSQEILNQLGVSEDPEVTGSEIETYLASRLREYISDSSRKNDLDSELYSLTGSKSNIDNGIKSIANNKLFAFSDLRKYYESGILKNIQSTYIAEPNYRNDIFSRILSYNSFAAITNTPDQINYIKKDLKCSVEKALYLALANGFTRKAIDVETGTKVANEGDSAQFIFLARAILAGYTCSNVDVRSSRYDAVIDYEGLLLRVQVKGISGTSIALKDRDRGGAGIDTSSRRNQGRFISSADADLYVAVDKQFGICYIIPTTVIDAWTSIGTTTVSISSLDTYKENWSQISDVAHNVLSKIKREPD